MAGMRPADVDHFAIGRNPRSNLWRKARFALGHRPSLRLGPETARGAPAASGTWARHSRTPSASTARASTSACTGSSTIRRISPARFSSRPSRRPPSAPSTASATSSAPRGPSAAGHPSTGLDRVYFPHSLGLFYLAITQHLGFTSYGDEYKVMGLAPYGAPDFAGALARVLRLLPAGGFALDLSYFRHASDGVRMTWDDGAPAIDPVFRPKLEELLGPARHPAEPLTSRHEAIAASLQAVFERAVFHVLRGLHARTRQPRPLPGRRLRHEQRRQRQDPRGDAVSAGVRAARRRRQRDGARGRLSRVEPAPAWLPALRHGPRLLGAPALASRPCGGARRADVRAGAAGHARHRARRRRGALPLHGRASRRGPGRRLVPGADGVGGARPRQPEHPRRSPAARTCASSSMRRSSSASRSGPSPRPSSRKRSTSTSSERPPTRS